MGWTLDRLDAALTGLDDQLAERGVRIDRDPAPTSPPPLRGLRARDRCLTEEQRTALHGLHGLRDLDPGLQVDTARVLHAIASAPRVFTEATTNSTRPPSSPYSNAGSSVATPAAATSNSPRTPGSLSRPDRPDPTADIFVAPPADMTCRSR